MTVSCAFLLRRPVHHLAEMFGDAFRTDPMREQGLGSRRHVFFDLLPLAIFIPDVLAKGARRQQPLQRADARAQGPGLRRQFAAQKRDEEQDREPNDGVDDGDGQRVRNAPGILDAEPNEAQGGPQPQRSAQSAVRSSTPSARREARTGRGRRQWAPPGSRSRTSAAP
jgi:hypothetical protein